jgi:uncharacterized protein (TIGR00297 family)
MTYSRQLLWGLGFLGLIAFTLTTDAAVQWRTTLAIMLAFSIAVLAFTLRMLSLDAVAPTTVVGAITLGFGGWMLALLLLFYFVSSSLWGIWGTQTNKSSKLWEVDRRDAHQVWANGFTMVFFLIVYQLTSWDWVLIGAISALATATADTWATEIGMGWAKRKPVNILTWKPTRPGQDGGITWMGTLGGLGGGLILAVGATILANYPEIKILSVVFGAATAGMLLDSVLGATWEQQLPPRLAHILEQKSLTNNQVNALSVFVSALLAMIFFI